MAIDQYTEKQNRPRLEEGTIVRCTCGGPIAPCVPCDKGLIGVTGKYWGGPGCRLVYITWSEKYREGDQLIGDWHLEPVV